MVLPLNVPQWERSRGKSKRVACHMLSSPLLPLIAKASLAATIAFLSWRSLRRKRVGSGECSSHHQAPNQEQGCSSPHQPRSSEQSICSESDESTAREANAQLTLAKYSSEESHLSNRSIALKDGSGEQQNSVSPELPSCSSWEAIEEDDACSSIGPERTDTPQLSPRDRLARSSQDSLDDSNVSENLPISHSGDAREGLLMQFEVSRLSAGEYRALLAAERLRQARLAIEHQLDSVRASLEADRKRLPERQ